MTADLECAEARRVVGERSRLDDGVFRIALASRSRFEAVGERDRGRLSPLPMSVIRRSQRPSSASRVPRRTGRPANAIRAQNLRNSVLALPRGSR